MINNIKFYDIDKVAKELDVSERTIHRYIEKDDLKAYKIGNRIRIKPKDLETFIESREM